MPISRYYSFLWKSSLLFGYLVLVLLTLLWIHFLETPIVKGGDYRYVLTRGTSAKQFVRDLPIRADVYSPLFFLIALKWEMGRRATVKAGEYVFPSGSLPMDVIRQVMQGKVAYHPFTLVEGWQFNDIVTHLHQTPGVQHELSSHSTKAITDALGMAFDSPEGWLLPDTYHYTLNTVDTLLLQRAYQAMLQYEKIVWPSRDKRCPYRSFYEALIVASLIEKETAIESEKPLIAAVILKRLHIGMPLQIDAAVAYGLHKSGKKLSKKDLSIDTPYNTYLHYGLPKTPIAMPSRSSIDAALHPAETDALYFVAKGDGGHEFSVNLKAHNRAVTQYRQNTIIVQDQQ